MRKTLSKHGNSYALVLEKSLMELLHITPETTRQDIANFLRRYL